MWKIENKLVGDVIYHWCVHISNISCSLLVILGLFGNIFTDNFVRLADKLGIVEEVPICVVLFDIGSENFLESLLIGDAEQIKDRQVFGLSEFLQGLMEAADCQQNKVIGLGEFFSEL